MGVALASIALGLVAAWLIHRLWFVPWASSWGSTASERLLPIAGDEYVESGPDGARSIRWTRAITVRAPSDRVWPWLAQLGRGAGFYAIDWMDNGRRRSARHLVQWIPEPHVGDASAIGYLHSIERGRTLEWRLPPAREAGHTVSAAFVYHLEPAGASTRVITRVTGNVVGPMPRLFEAVFRVVDTMMMRAQLRGLRERVERHGIRDADPDAAETGKRDQFQLYHVIYAPGGEEAGVEGNEKAPTWYAAGKELLGDRFGE